MTFSSFIYYYSLQYRLGTIKVKLRGEKQEKNMLDVRLQVFPL